MMQNPPETHKLGTICSTKNPKELQGRLKFVSLSNLKTLILLSTPVTPLVSGRFNTYGKTLK